MLSVFSSCLLFFHRTNKIQLVYLAQHPVWTGYGNSLPACMFVCLNLWVQSAGFRPDVSLALLIETTTRFFCNQTYRVLILYSMLCVIFSIRQSTTVLPIGTWPWTFSYSNIKIIAWWLIFMRFILIDLFWIFHYCTQVTWIKRPNWVLSEFDCFKQAYIKVWLHFKRV